MLFEKFIVNDQNKLPFIFKMEVYMRTDVLFLKFSVHNIINKDRTSNLRTSFDINPNDSKLFESVQTNKSIEIEYNQNQITKVYYDLEKEINNSNSSDDKIFVKLEQYKIIFYKTNAQLILSFIKQYIDNYDFIKLKILEGNKTEVEQLSQRNVKISSDKIDDIFFKNNIIKFYIFKKIHENNSLNFSNKNYILELPFIYKFIDYDLNFILTTLEITKDDGIELIKLIIKEIIYYLNTSMDDEEKSFNLQVLINLSFIYYLKITNVEIIDDLNEQKFIQTVNSYLKKILDKYYNTTDYSKNNLSISIKNVNTDVKNIESLLDKYNYLKNINKNLFIDNIIKDNSNKKTQNIILNNPSPINIDNYFLYNHIESTIYSNKIITKEYFDFIKLNKSDTYNNDICPLIKFNFNNIVDNYIPKLVENIDDIKKYPSLLFIYDILFEQSNLTFLEEYDILLKFVIPYLYDNYEICVFINHFL